VSVSADRLRLCAHVDNCHGPMRPTSTPCGRPLECTRPQRTGVPPPTKSRPFPMRKFRCFSFVLGRDGRKPARGGFFGAAGHVRRCAAPCSRVRAPPFLTAFTEYPIPTFPRKPAQTDTSISHGHTLSTDVYQYVDNSTKSLHNDSLRAGNQYAKPAGLTLSGP